jgi:hypothetical protein
MSGINVISLSYLFSRLSPFIIVSYFILQSIFNQNLKGIFYVAGVLLACFLNFIIVGENTRDDANPVCSIIEGMPSMPLGQTILGFTFTYLSYIIIVHKLTDTNAGTFIIFPILIISDFIWNFRNKCTEPLILITSFVIGSIFGGLWGMIIDAIDPELQFFNGIGNKNICKRPSKTLYKCKVSRP